MSQNPIHFPFLEWRTAWTKLGLLNSSLNWTSSGSYEYKVMPFRLRNAAATFQRLMNQVVANLDGCAVYVDDVVVYSDTWGSHLERLHHLFTRLAHANLTVNLAKCEFAR